jgi:uracil-DNA glycosylase
MSSARVTGAGPARVAALAGDCADLAELATAVVGCTACTELAASRTRVVVGDTPPAARLLLVGEAPGASEDRTGRPFVGAAGRLLDELMSDAGLERDRVAVLNVVKCRPPGNRAPRRSEARSCAGWLDRQVECADPDVVVTLGRTALSWAIGDDVGIEAMRRQVHDWRGRRLIVSYHPSAALRFGPRGAPRAALAADLRFATETLSCS